MAALSIPFILAQRRPKRSSAWRAPAAIVLLVGALGAAKYFDLRLNVSPSYPVGIYRGEPITGPLERGRLAFVCPPARPVFELALERGYLSAGDCPESGTMPLLKRIVALAGARIEIGEAVAIDGIVQPISTPYPADGLGRPLPRYEGGIVPEGAVFLLSDHYAWSFDSRYFGPVPMANVLSYATPILTR